jgi:hypothetical protein
MLTRGDGLVRGGGAIAKKRKRMVPRRPPSPIRTATGLRWEVEAVLQTRDGKHGKEYLVRWKGYTDSANSWISELPAYFRAGYKGTVDLVSSDDCSSEDSSSEDSSSEDSSSEDSSSEDSSSEDSSSEYVKGESAEEEESGGEDSRGAPEDTSVYVLHAAPQPLPPLPPLLPAPAFALELPVAPALASIDVSLPPSAAGAPFTISFNVSFTRSDSA